MEYLRIDLGRAAERRELRNAELYVGGIGLATRLLFDETPARVDPLSPGNALILAAAPLVGTPVTTTSKYAVVTKSPLTGFIADSLSSSHFALQLRRSSVGAFVIVGRAPQLSTLILDDERAELRATPELAGLSARDVAEKFPGFSVAAIGPAGERLVKFATISNDGRHAGRAGVGAVMGSKNLKAIAIRGSRDVAVHDRAALEGHAGRLRERSLGPQTAKYREVGTTANMLALDRLAALPTRNFQSARFEGAEALSGESMKHVGREFCASCTIGCTHLFEVNNEPVRLEYESAFALGPLVGVQDPDAVLRAVKLCDELGMDTISAGGTLAWAMESCERGVFDAGLRFGDDVGNMLRAMARREGPGDLLAEGSRAAAKKVGRGSDAWAMHVKGLEMPGYEPRTLKTLALGLAVGARGACHNRSGAYDADLSGEVDRFTLAPGRGAIAAASEDHAAVMDSLIVCKFLRRCFDDFYTEGADLLNAVTGGDHTADSLRRVGERVVNLKKLFNIREGWTRADDTLPARCLEDEVAGVRLTRPELEAAISDYYRARGWNSDGTIPDAVIRELRL